MNYMLLIYHPEPPMGDAGDRHDECLKICEDLVGRLERSHRYIAGGILQPTTCATTVQLREGQRQITDGPFAETREQLGGFLFFQAENLDEAISVAFQHPVSQYGSIEIRPVQEVPFLMPSLPAKA
ncbi:MAG: YciI family protein [Fimbriimonas sp.]